MGSENAIWPLVRKLWKDLARAHSTFWDDSDDGDSDRESPKQLALASLCASLAKFTRNLVAGVPDNQSKAA
jgi:ataxin-10